MFETVSEFLDFHLKVIMQSSMSYIKYSGDFIRQLQSIQSISSNAVLVTVDVVELHPLISVNSGFKACKNILDKRKNRNMLTAQLIKITECVLMINYVEFSQGKTSRIVIRTMLTYTWKNLKMSFSVQGVTNLWSGVGILMTFFYIDMKKKNFIIEDLNNTNLTSSLHVYPVKFVSLFLIWTAIYQRVSLQQIYISSLQINTNNYILCHPI